MKVTAPSEGYQNMRLCYCNVLPNEMFTGTINIYNNSSTEVYLRLIEIETNQFNDISIPPNEFMQKITITRTITSTSTLSYMLIIREPTTVYIDNTTFNKR